MIAQNGYHNAQVSRIAREANVADGTIYLYFENKDHLLVSLFNEKIGQLIHNCGEQIRQQTAAEEKLALLIYSHLEHMAKDPQLATVTQIELRQVNPHIREGISEVLQSYFQLIDEVIQAGIQQGVFRADIDLRIARKMIFGTLDEVVTAWVMKQYKYDLVSLAEPILNLFLRGLSGKP